MHRRELSRFLADVVKSAKAATPPKVKRYMEQNCTTTARKRQIRGEGKISQEVAGMAILAVCPYAYSIAVTAFRQVVSLVYTQLANAKADKTKLFRMFGLSKDEQKLWSRILNDTQEIQLFTQSFEIAYKNVHKNLGVDVAGAQFNADGSESLLGDAEFEQDTDEYYDDVACEMRKNVRMVFDTLFKKNVKEWQNQNRKQMTAAREAGIYLNNCNMRRYDDAGSAV